MATTITLQKLGQTMEEGTVVSCKVKVGDKINRGDVIFDIETDKATVEMESPAAGTVKEILVAEGQTIPVNDPMMIIE